MAADAGPPWKCVETHGPSGNQIFQRTVEFTHTGNNEGTMTDEIEVRSAAGTLLASTEMSIEWEYFGQISACFEKEGARVRVSGSGEPSETLTLPAGSNHKTGETPSNSTEESHA